MGSRQREYIPKKIREEVYTKYNGKCAYCGKEIEYKDMQVDHFIPFRRGQTQPELREQIESIDNYVCSCRMCNYYKRARGVESMRHDIEKIYKQLELSFDYRLAKRYGMIQETPKKVKFYFEDRDDGKIEK